MSPLYLGVGPGGLARPPPLDVESSNARTVLGVVKLSYVVVVVVDSSLVVVRVAGGLQGLVGEHGFPASIVETVRRRRSAAASRRERRDRMTPINTGRSSVVGGARGPETTEGRRDAMASCLNRARARAFTFAAGLARSTSSSPRGMSGGVRQNSCSATQKASPYPIGSTATMSTAKAAEKQIAVSGSTTTIISAKRSAAAFFGLSVCSRNAWRTGTGRATSSHTV